MIRRTVLDACRGPLCGTGALDDLLRAGTPDQESKALERALVLLLSMVCGHAGEASNNPFTRAIWLAKLDRAWPALEAVRSEIARQRAAA